jgi:hypothetical protein
MYYSTSCIRVGQSDQLDIEGSAQQATPIKTSNSIIYPPKPRYFGSGYVPIVIVYESRENLMFRNAQHCTVNILNI